MPAVRGASRGAGDPPPPRRPGGRVSSVGIALLALSAIFFGINFAHEWLISHQTQATAAQLQRQIDQINAQNQHLQSQLAYYGSKEYIVPEARAKLGLARPGDTLINVVQLPPRIRVVRVPAQPPAPHESLFVRLLRAIFQ